VRETSGPLRSDAPHEEDVKFAKLLKLQLCQWRDYATVAIVSYSIVRFVMGLDVFGAQSR
jgi:hypothetical protein